MADTLLTYDFATTPDPLTVSPATGELTFVVSNNTRQEINCASISFTILVGENAKDLTSGASGITATSGQGGWTFQQSGSGGVFTAKPKTPADGKLGRAGLSFTLTGVKINNQPGTTLVTVTEEAAQGSAPGQVRTTKLALAKFPANFFLDELKAEPPVVAEGGATKISWNGAGNANYTLQYGDTVITHRAGEPTTPLKPRDSYTVTDLEDNPTVFYLTVTHQVLGQDSPVTVQRHFSVTVESVGIRAFDVRPAVVGVNGVTRLGWRTKNAASCTLDPGNHTVPPNGHMYVVVPRDTTYTLTALGASPDSTPAQSQRAVTVDSSIVLTGNGSTHLFAGADGQDGPPGSPGDRFSGGAGMNGGNGLPAPSARLNISEPLDTSSKPSVVSLIRVVGGKGGRGGNGGSSTGGAGGRGGNGGNGGGAGDLTVVFKSDGRTPSQFIVENVGGKGGEGGKGGQGVGGPGPDGTSGRDGAPGTTILQEGAPSQVAAQLDAFLLAGEAADEGAGQDSEQTPD